MLITFPVIVYVIGVQCIPVYLPQQKMNIHYFYAISLLKLSKLQVCSLNIYYQYNTCKTYILALTCKTYILAYIYNRSCPDRESNRGSPTFRADVLIIIPLYQCIIIIQTGFLYLE